MLLILNESGMIAGLDTATFGYVAMFSALIVYLSGGMVGSYKGRRDALVRDMLIWLALGSGIVILYIFAQSQGFFFERAATTRENKSLADLHHRRGSTYRHQHCEAKTF